jgi:hypothetical protein
MSPHRNPLGEQFGEYFKQLANAVDRPDQDSVSLMIEIKIDRQDPRYSVLFEKLKAGSKSVGEALAVCIGWFIIGLCVGMFVVAAIHP